MEKYYHFTSYESLENISKNGLVPGRGLRTRTVGDKRNAVFLSCGIKNAMLMYSTLLHHYSSFTGNRGLKIIESYQDKFKWYQENKNSLDQDDIAEMKAINEAFVWINEIMKYKSFYEYIEDGVYLTVLEATDVIKTDLMDCYTDQIISPEKIKVVLLKNKETGEILDNREQILAFFMSITPIESIIDNEHNVVTIKNIKDLYENKLNDIRYYNSDNFEIEEVPINLYIDMNKKSKKINKKLLSQL